MWKQYIKEFKKNLNKSPILKYGLVIIVIILWSEFIYDRLNLTINKQNEQIETLRKDIKKYTKLNKDLENIEKELNSLKEKRKNQDSLFLSKDDPTILASQLQDIILKKANENKMQVITYRVSNQKRWKNYILVSTYFNFKTDLVHIVSFLESVERDPRLFRIHLVDILPVKGVDPHIRFSIEVEALSYTKGDKK